MKNVRISFMSVDLNPVQTINIQFKSIYFESHVSGRCELVEWITSKGVEKVIFKKILTRLLSAET